MRVNGRSICRATKATKTFFLLFVLLSAGYTRFEYSTILYLVRCTQESNTDVFPCSEMVLVRGGFRGKRKGKGKEGRRYAAPFFFASRVESRISNRLSSSEVPRVEVCNSEERESGVDG